MASGSETQFSLRYSRASRLLHWLTVLLVLTTIPAGLVMVQEGLPRALQDTLFLYHKNIGPIILLLVVLRLVVRLIAAPPPLPASVSALQALAAKVVHWLLYIVLVALVISGIVRVQAGGFPMEVWDPLLGGMIAKDEALAKSASGFHELAKSVLIVLIAMHVGAVALHGLVKRDGVFSRMWPPA
ncbi:cytochrome b [Salipiger thiooxidans]|uniref:cytochrome b n=1 Tax=Salipiger thiooxidans TaxID=282683 RepID=UPI001CD348B8|nr:cytochrome b/b6 domain-containing protein [Salipiger thiooxidans]MCA0850117.1 cytochrome b/b6 domain-containing protein [Salipiger thiooxidans]